VAEVSPVDALPRPLGVAVHDAGAANMIAAWVEAAAAPPDRVVAAGPALAIWRARFGNRVPVADDPEELAEMACVLSGTGWGSDLEHRARLVAARSRLRSVAVIDHWVNYAMRFEREGVVQLPDLLWVGDLAAERIARTTFPGLRVERHANLYLAEQARDAGPPPADGDVLFLLEPVHGGWGRAEPGEFQALDFFMARRERAGVEARSPVRLRPHPSDPPGKYEAWLERHPGTKLDASADMAGALREARWVVGLNSAGLIIALEAGRTVISALPPHAPPCVLPHRRILHLSRL
jgi:hypothetical protein